MAKKFNTESNPHNNKLTPKQNGNTAVMEEAPQINRASQAKQRITVQISVDVIERVKNAVYWTPGLTLTSLAVEALSIAVDKLEKARKEPFPKRGAELTSGRPVKLTD